MIDLAADVEIIGVDEWGDSSVNLICRFKVVPPIQQWSVRREFLRRLKKAYDARGIEIPFPHLTVYAGELKDGQRAGLQRERSAALAVKDLVYAAHAVGERRGPGLKDVGGIGFHRARPRAPRG